MNVMVDPRGAGHEAVDSGVDNNLGEWIPNESDIRPRAIQMFGMLSELYAFRHELTHGRERSDVGKMFHWRKVAGILAESDVPVCTPPQVDMLLRVRGIGDSTWRALHTIRECGFLDFIVDFCNEIVDIVDSGAGEISVDRSQDFSKLRMQIEKLDAATLNTRVSLAQQHRRAYQYSASENSRSAVTAPTTVVTVTIAEFQERFPEREGTCVVCLEAFTHDDALHLLRCSHVFHASCIGRWLTVRKDMRVKPSCPMCRATIN